MTFSSLIFVLLFFPVFLTIYFLVPGQSRKNAVLLLFSLVFYAFGGIGALFLLITETFLAWCTGLFLDRLDENDPERKRLLVLNTGLFLFVLAIFKYLGFFTRIVNRIAGLRLPILNIVLPLGISFFTFKLISYVADVYLRRCRAERNFWLLLIYTCQFHHVLQGPIVRYADTKSELRVRQFRLADLSQGTLRFCFGLAKKAILADQCGRLADTLYPAAGGIGDISTCGIWLGSLLFSLQIYLDFSAYSDMALGLGQMIGFHFKENFNYPYIASSIRDFWRRWHISLSMFFRDYVYIPMGGNRVGFLRQILNLLTVWLLTGLWHGSNWNYILWGLYYFILIVIENIIARLIHPVQEVQADSQPESQSASQPGNRALQILKRVLLHIYTLLAVNFGWLLFRFEDFSELKLAAAGYFGHSPAGFYSRTLSLTVTNNIILILVAVLVCTPLYPVLYRKAEVVLQEKRVSKAVLYSAQLLLAAVLLVLAICAMAGNTYSPFLYNEF